MTQTTELSPDVARTVVKRAVSAKLAEEIDRTHRQAQNLANEAKDHAQAAIEAGVECGNYIRDAKRVHRGKYIAWIRDNVPDVTQDQVKAYLTLAKMWDERECHAIDGHQMHLLGIVPTATRTPGTETAHKVDASKWVTYIGKIKAQLDTVSEARPIDEWTEEERDVTRAHLEPIVDFYRKLGGKL